MLNGFLDLQIVDCSAGAEIPTGASHGKILKETSLAKPKRARITMARKHSW